MRPDLRLLSLLWQKLAAAPLKLCRCSVTVAAVILHALGVGAKIMERFRMFRRAGGNFYTRDKVTGRSESFGTSDRTQAKQLLAARNQAAAQPQLNRTMAKAFLSAKSSDLLTRTWADVMEHYSITGVESTRKSKATAFRSRPSLICAGFRYWIRKRNIAGRPRTRAGRKLGASLPPPPAQLRVASRLAANACHGRCGTAGSAEKEVYGHHRG